MYLNIRELCSCIFYFHFSKPKFLEAHVQRIIEGWDESKTKATQRLVFLQNTKAAWLGYADGLENIVVEFEKAEDEIKKVKKRFNLVSAFEDLEKRQKIFAATKNTVDTMWATLNKDFDMMTQTLPEDKKDFVKKELKATAEKLPVVERFHEKVQKIENFVSRLDSFNKSLKEIDSWMLGAEGNLNDVKTKSDQMTPEDRVSHTMELQEDVSAKVDMIKKNVAEELDLLPQGKNQIYNILILLHNIVSTI
jgi:hypothetical protein